MSRTRGRAFSRLVRLERTAAEVAPEGVAVAAARITMHAPPLHPDERPRTSDYGPLRFQEFSWGRACARRALTKLGGPGHAPIGATADGAPRWPHGFQGSISHSGGAACAVAALDHAVSSIGLDLTARTGLNPDHARLWCTPGELLRLRVVPEPLRPGYLARLFAAKESARKCLARCLGYIPSDSSVDLIPMPPATTRSGHRVIGRFEARTSGVWVSVAALPSRHLWVAVAVATSGPDMAAAASLRCVFKSSSSLRTA